MATLAPARPARAERLLGRTKFLESPRWDLAYLGVLFYLFVEYFRPGQMYPFLQPFQLGKLSVGIALAGWVIARAATRDPRARTLGMDFAILGFLLVNFLAAAAAQSTILSWVGFQDAIRIVLIYFLISRVLATEWRLRLAMLMVVVLNLKLAQHAIRNFSQFGSSATRVDFGGGSAGYFGNSADFGVAMCVIWPIALALAMTEKRRLWKWGVFATLPAFFGAILVCGSRGAVVGAAASAVVLLARNPKRIGVLFVVVLLALGVQYVLPDWSKNRIERVATDWRSDPTASHRIYMWSAGIKMFQDYPLLGVGQKNFPREHNKYAHAENTRTAVTYVPHSLYIEALAETGGFGFLFVLLVFGSVFWFNAKTRRIAMQAAGGKPSAAFGMALGLDVALVGYMASGAFVSVLYYPHLWILAGLTAALYRATAGQSSVQQQTGAKEPARTRLALASSRGI